MLLSIRLCKMYFAACNIYINLVKRLLLEIKLNNCKIKLFATDSTFCLKNVSFVFTSGFQGQCKILLNFNIIVKEGCETMID